MKFTKIEIKKIAESLNVNLNFISIETLQNGIKVELEHGTRYLKTNVTNNDLKTTLKIVLAHLQEFPDYYDRLEDLEKEAKKFWKGKKFNIFLEKKKKL